MLLDAPSPSCRRIDSCQRCVHLIIQLYLANTEQGKTTLMANHEMQKQCGAEGIALLDPEEIARRFPWMRTEDLTIGSFGGGVEGIFDPVGLHAALKRKAIELGNGRVSFVNGEACGFRLSTNNRIEEVHYHCLEGGDSKMNTRTMEALRCGAVVNCAGPFANSIVEMLRRSMEASGHAASRTLATLPVAARKRNIFVVKVPGGNSIECPLVINPSGVFVRKEGPGNTFICGFSPPEADDPNQADNSCLDDVNYDEFDHVWAKLYERAEIFAGVKVISGWSGFYDYNYLDHNAILGPHSSVGNLIFANGFSGHGVQQAPAVGRAVSEIIIDSKFVSLDLNRFRFTRFEEGQLVHEDNVI